MVSFHLFMNNDMPGHGIRWVDNNVMMVVQAHEKAHQEGIQVYTKHSC
jgi:hypothetical protein